ncbi:MAG: T9SS type A sorting domain-containing protein [Chitinophagales bacterium]|nr:T9SS type A sorting domain-containing protein [Chitinophagales bacterium]
MRKIIVSFSALLFSLQLVSGQIIWQNTIGGKKYDECVSFQKTQDKGFILAAQSNSDAGEIHQNLGGADIVLIKLDSLGNVKWIKNFGGSDHDLPYAIKATKDGGFIVVGNTASNDFDVNGNHGGLDAWIFKVDGDGGILWQRCFGGTKDDEFRDVIPDAAGGFLICGSTRSSDGDITLNQGGSDYWAVKLDSVGSLEWSKTYGGNSLDDAWAIEETHDGGYVIGGESYSTNGDVSGNNGTQDAWLIKINWEGKIIWQNCFGGIAWEGIRDIISAEEEGFIMTGFTASNNGDVSGNHGADDAWLFKVDAFGSLLWQRPFGGSQQDLGFALCKSIDGGYWAASVSRSNDGDLTNNKGSQDVWIFKLSEEGSLLWERSLGGSLIDFAKTIELSHDGKCVFAGYTRSQNGDLSGPVEEADIWVVKLDENVPSATTQADYIPLELYPNPSQHRIFLQLLLDELMYISITDWQGRVLQTASINAHQSLDISALPPGAYVLSATAKSGQLYVGKFVKE